MQLYEAQSASQEGRISTSRLSDKYQRKGEASFPLHEKSDYSIIIIHARNNGYNYILGKYSGKGGNWPLLGNVET